MIPFARREPSVLCGAVSTEGARHHGMACELLSLIKVFILSELKVSGTHNVQYCKSCLNHIYLLPLRRVSAVCRCLPRLQSPFCGTAFKSLKVDLIANYDVIRTNTAFSWSQMKSEPSKTLECIEFLFLYDAVIEIKFRQCLPKVLKHLC